jgi:hypothetical protein
LRHVSLSRQVFHARRGGHEPPFLDIWKIRPLLRDWMGVPVPTIFNTPAKHCRRNKALTLCSIDFFVNSHCLLYPIVVVGAVS